MKHRYMNRLITCLACWSLAVSAAAQPDETVRDVAYTSAADNTEQRTMLYVPLADEDSDAPVPMIVALHTWSGDYQQQNHRQIQEWCVANGWAYLHPNFRGRNNRPEATGSQLVVDDILSAVAFAQTQTAIDADHIYLVGTSGGGYTALLMAGHHPEVWAGVSAWVPITDLAAWHRHCTDRGLGYARDIELSCGGPPGTSRDVNIQYRRRSPIAHLNNARDLPIHINAGIRDGHDGSVPITHSLRAYNALADEEDRFAPWQYRQLAENPNELPEGVEPAEPDPTFGNKQPLVRRTSNNVTLTIFNGAHEMVHSACIAWVAAQYEAAQNE